MIKVGIVGITGYTGEELLKILSKHPNVEIVGLYGRKFNKEKHLADVYPYFNLLNLKIEPLNIKKIINTCEILFLALPHSVSFEIVPYLFDYGVRIIDLSADFRLNKTDIYEKWYKVNHMAKEYIDKAIYGLSELNANKINKATLVANPGCYPTTVILGCAPAIKNDFVDTEKIIIDSKSGISGSGRNGTKEYFDNEHPNFKAYKIAGSHRHIPEIEQELSILSGKDISVSFTPHIIPMERGMMSTIYMDIKKQISKSEIFEAYNEFYKRNHFIKIIDDDVVFGIKDVLNTNYCKIIIKIDKRTNKLIIISAIDNLIKGASGQAIQNMNIMFNLPEITGLI
ncbi:MAG: N-acetyl-gamma-glutamyl-phosphate reductase [Endomicrobium sp.]|jgi:N-acetyl-gamma-glutamyl-phosphate reductase|nr:N-acetyl-gamma-glutamyl-phosphate reductase [Endomicrobium sp.]